MKFIDEDESEKFKLDMELRVEERKWFLSMVPAARTPTTQEGVNALNDMTRQLFKQLDNLLPWVLERRKKEISERMKRPPQSKVTIIED